MSEREKFEVGRNRCNCHPETCCCPDWAIYTHYGNTHSKHRSKEVAEEICRALNKVAESAPEIAALRTELEQARKDAERFNKLMMRLSVRNDPASPTGYTFIVALPSPISNPMRGSVVQHFAAAIDAAKELGK